MPRNTPPDILLAQSPAMTFAKVQTEKARAVIRSTGLDPESLAFWPADVQGFAAWAMAQGLRLRFGGLDLLGAE